MEADDKGDENEEGEVWSEHRHSYASAKNIEMFVKECCRPTQHPSL